MRNFASLVITAILLSGCAHSPSAVEKTLTYPYIATPERQAQVFQGVEKIKVGMSSADVRSCMGDPDEVKNSYDPNISLKNRDPIGYSWWYIIERKTESGSVTANGLKLVRASFDLNDTLTQVDSRGVN